MSTELPSELTAKASLRGKEYAWRPQEFRDALSLAASLGLACIGGEFEFRVPDGTCNLYWRNVDSTERAQGEDWRDYATRSIGEVRDGFDRLLATADFRRDAQNFDHLREKLAAGRFDPLEHLCFVAYFVDEHVLEGLTKRCR